MSSNTSRIPLRSRDVLASTSSNNKRRAPKNKTSRPGVMDRLPSIDSIICVDCQEPVDGTINISGIGDQQHEGLSPFSLHKEPLHFSPPSTLSSSTASFTESLASTASTDAGLPESTKSISPRSILRSPPTRREAVIPRSQGEAKLEELLRLKRVSFEKKLERLSVMMEVRPDWKNERLDKMVDVWRNEYWRSRAEREHTLLFKHLRRETPIALHVANAEETMDVASGEVEEE